MGERNLSLNEIFTSSKTQGKSRLCAVKFCRNPRLPNRTICAKCKQHAWRMRNPTKSAYRVIKDRAVRKKIAFTLSFEEFVEICEATGYIENKGRRADELHLDRIDPRKGYEVENLRVITCSDNSRKGSYERKVQLSNGRWVTLYEIGLGVPLPPEDSDEDDAFFDSLWTPSNDIDFTDQPEEPLDENCPF